MRLIKINCAMLKSIISTCLILIYHVIQSEGHGRLVEPPSRSSMWRYGFQTPINYDDNQLFCGGYDVQWNQNGGRCGVCGDPYNGRRDNEAGGKYATGTISRHYSEGQTILITIDVTTNHGGYFEFRICPNNNPSRPVTESCLNMNILRQPNGETKWRLPTGARKFSLNIVLPRGLTCSQCVLQWKWNTASNWGCDDNNNCCKGCGPQEQFLGCADVSISSSGNSYGTNNNNNNNNAQSVFGGTQIGDMHIGAKSPDTIAQSFIPVGSNGVNHAASNIGSQNIGSSNLGSQNLEAHNLGSINLEEQNIGAPNLGAHNIGSPNIGSPNLGSQNLGSPNICTATDSWKTRYIFADQWCRSQCAAGNCPMQYCKDTCRF